MNEQLMGESSDDETSQNGEEVEISTTSNERVKEHTKRKKRRCKKAPGAPIRGRSAYILFAMDHRDKIKAELPDGHKVTEVMRAIGALWRDADAETKQKYSDMAKADKDRYEDEMKDYHGPLKVPSSRKHKQKDPNAPKGRQTPYFCFANVKRDSVKAQNPEATSQEVAKILGEAWRQMSAQEKEPYEEMSKIDELRYLEEMDGYKSSKPDNEPHQYHVVAFS